ncbi:agglutination protein [Sphingomonas oleivorans]|uniref:Agglutination protein n=1 Tax=Sphingomonas oleivorans TaxID=1735121 RepID=A0A2T5G083_9SPHN|nr:TolC family protein [Sphingomonas oleivorans]PTQ12354.1 agglutination protein [Sphingomonas oleivorans]
MSQTLYLDPRFGDRAVGSGASLPRPSGPLAFVLVRSLMVAALISFAPGRAHAQAPILPPPSRDPLAIDPSRDMILALGRSSGSAQQFRDAIAEAVRRHPAIDESFAGAREAAAGRRAARQTMYPSIDTTLSTYRVLSREFSDDPNNIIERSRAKTRTDAILSVQQTLVDFGAASSRVAAASARIRAANAEIDNTADGIALRAIGAWYDVFAFNALVRLAEAFVESQRQLRQAVEQRIAQGVSAPGDIARVDSYIASASTRLAGYRRSRAEAEARFQELFGLPAPPGLMRASTLPAIEGERMAQGPEPSIPAVRVAEALAEAARREARAIRAETAPLLAAGIDAGRYGVFETDRDYDIRARLTLRMRLFGGIDPQADEARARAEAAEARAFRVREEAARDAAIAASDVDALERQLVAVEENYLASRRSRDVLQERFRVARGTLFDVLATEDDYFETAATYIRAVADLDTARYVLLSRTGRLLAALSIAPTSPVRP